MSVGGVSSGGSNGATAASYLNSPAVQLSRLQGSSLSTLFGGATGNPSDLVSFTSAAVAMPLYQHAGLLTGLTQWDGSMTPGSQRTAAPAADAPAAPPAPIPAPAAKSPFTFNPFDQASWWTDPKGSSVDLNA